MFSRSTQNLVWSIAVAALALLARDSFAQFERHDDESDAHVSTSADGTIATERRTATATVHWQGVPLGETLDRLKLLFNEPVFVDRRVDPNQRVTLDMSASSAEQALSGIADACGLDVARLGRLLYLAPTSVAGRLRPLASLRARDVARLPGDVRSTVLVKHALSWPRLSEPRQIAMNAVKQCGWRLANPEAIPHDLWAANELPEMSLTEELTVLLIGFDLTFEFERDQQLVRILPLSPGVAPAVKKTVRSHTPSKATTHSAGGTKQVYTLHVQEKPVGAVLRELANRLHWSLQIDEDAIRAAGKSLDQRVSFSVTNADQEKLLDALLEPAGLEYREEGDQILVVPQRHGK
ncbi:MAG TPA: STN domain-containing protein [Lacipirellulaceae bacterium]|nr:STN domain-containing protein [Lacipirellulaceae bacterium]